MVTKKPLSEDISIRQTENIGIITLDFPGALHWSQYKVKIITILSKIAPIIVMEIFFPGAATKAGMGQQN